MDRSKSEVEQFITDNELMTVEVSPGVSYNVREVIDNSYRLYNAQFKDNPVEPSGFKNIFTRKMWVVYRTLIQGSDMDLKDFKVRSINGVRVRIVAMLRSMITSHLSRTFFNEFVDKVMAEMCWFGTSIVKRFDGTVDTVDLRNYITEPNIQDPQERKHLELCYYTYDQMLSYKDDWKDNWEDIETVWATMQKEGESQFKVLDFWTWETMDGKVHKVCKRYLDNTITEKDQFHNVSDWVPYIELDTFKTPYKKARTSKRLIEKLGKDEEMFPYEQFDLFKVFGRAIAMGCAELLAGCEEMYDELFNEKRKLTRKALMGVTVHTAIQGVNGLTQLTQDFLSNLTTGSVITLAPGETLTQEQIDTKGNDFDMMESKIYELMRQIIGITSQGTGEEMPASTSATQASINQQVANTVFDYTRERMHHGMKRLFNNGYGEDVINEMSEKEMIAIVGEPAMLEEFDKILVDNAINKWAEDTKNATGMYPTEEEIAMNKDRVHQELMEMGDMRFPQFKKELIKDMEWMVEFEMTQEGLDYKLRSDAIIGMKNDPTSTKSKAKLEDELLSLQGLNPRQYDLSPEEKAQKEQEKMMQLQSQGAMMQSPSPVV